MSLRRDVTFALVALLGGVAAQLSAQETSAVRVRGVVVGSQGGVIAGALVEIARARDSTRTDARGEFSFSAVFPGVYRLRVRALGYRETYEDIRVERDIGWTGTIVMYRVAQSLPGVTVRATSRPPEFASTTKYDDYFRRQRLGFGTFRSREDFLKLGAHDVASALRNIPGVIISSTVNVYGEPEIHFRMARCPGQPPNISVYLNGMRVAKFGDKGSELSGAGAPRRAGIASTCPECVRLLEMIGSVPFHDVQFVEFYRGPGQVPAEFDLGDSCAALAIWTR